MMNIGTAQITSTAAPSAFFARWADMATWPEWNADTEWVRLDGLFETGATGVLKPKGGPRTKFVVAELTDDRFIDVSSLAGARLTFSHFVESTPEGGTKVRVTVTLAGPLSRLWNLILGKGIKETLQRDLESLKAVAEASSVEGLASGSPA
ncbi:SRPBCC family protein [Streptomyces graminilatus]|uniref:SRPBCC family protein n=1 Tax=Streptomyces graminilatus TaxID=1464070 RepID=UPI0006E30BE2|nr:SRPBCC family protein [Streptomyces graminilatus]